MPIQLAGTFLSPHFQIALTVAHEVNLPVSILPVDFTKGEHHLPQNLAHQPFGYVPYLLDGDFSLYESRAIARYFALLQKSALVPDGSDVKKVAKFEQAASTELTNWAPFVFAVALDTVWAPSVFDDASKAKHLADLNKKLDVFEGILGKQKYVAGDEISLIDFFYIPFAYTVIELGKVNIFDPATRPNLARWWKDVSARPSWLAVKAQSA
ncbi:hypothetical protein EUX98_g1623 [Antrodiella citrinella]|uniref:glutathione transferase n=1 Tax=Antrodiella citrinella TaxID=2447956 RepID=A0A4S4N115_9APHY|nr:hypothetical protein EUX98_g1623 [Antrodiella citrinella]